MKDLAAMDKETSLIIAIGKEYAEHAMFGADKMNNIKFYQIGLEWLETKSDIIKEKICKNYKELLESPESQLAQTIADILLGLFDIVSPITVARLIVTIGLNKYCSESSTRD